MAKKPVVEKDVAALKKELEEGRLVLGKDRTEKGLRSGTLQKIYLSSNTPASAEMEKHAKLGGVELVRLKSTNEELGIICKKPFSVSMVGVLK